MRQSSLLFHAGALLSALLFAGASQAQARATDAPAAQLMPQPPVAALPDAPVAAQGAQSASPDIKLPSTFSPAWAVSRSPLPGKVSYYLASAGSVRNFAEAFLIAGVPNIPSPPIQPNPDGVPVGIYTLELDIYGDATQVWLDHSYELMRYHLDRLEVGLATAETRQLASNLLLPIALHQEARYIPAPPGSDLGQRMWNAALSIVETRDDHGRTVPNYSKLGGTVAAAFAGKSFYSKQLNAPELDSGRFLTRYIAYSLAGDLATNAAHELVRAAVDPDLTMASMHGRSTEDSYYPLSAGAKFINWAHSSYGARPIVSAAFLAGLPRIVDEPIEPKPNQPSTYEGYPNYVTAYDQWGFAVLAWRDSLEEGVRYTGRRFGGGLAEAETQVLLAKLVLPILLDEEPRYIPLGAGHNAGARMGHAIKGIVETRTDAGGHTLNLPVLLGTAGAAVLAKELYYPTLGTPGLASNGVLVGTIGLNLLADILGNVKNEFWRHRGY